MDLRVANTLVSVITDARVDAMGPETLIASSVWNTEEVALVSVRVDGAEKPAHIST